MSLIGLLVSWLVNSVSLFLISKLPTGVEISSFQKALVSAIVFGLLNAFVRPIIAFFSFPHYIFDLWFILFCHQWDYFCLSRRFSGWLFSQMGILECFNWSLFIGFH